MQSHNLQYASARCVLHFFHFVKEQTSNNRQAWLVDQEVRQSNEISSSTCLTSRTHICCTTLHEFWWSWSGSNRRPTACKAAALPAELQPPLVSSNQKDLVGLVGFEPTTPALSRRCSNQLSYRPSHMLRGSSPEQPISCGYLADCSLFS